MNDCATCGASFDCTDPLALYSLQSVSFPFVPICPAGVTCDIGSDFHLICCQQDIFIQFPPGFDATQKQGVIAGAVAECQRQAAFCLGCENPPCVPCPTPPCVLNLYWNHSETCSVNCPDGTPFSATIVAGTYLATSQIEADTFAFRGACARAKDHRICLSALDEALCADDAASLEIKGTGKYLANGTGSDFWAVVDGEIPTGMTFNGGFRTDRKCVIDGTPTTAGVYTFTVRVTVWTPGAAFGDYTEKSYTVKVVGIAPATLPEATIGTAYSQNLTVSPTHDQETEQWILLTSLPAGLTMTEAGVITGTPTGPTESHDVEVQVEFTLDGKQVTCGKEYTLTVNDGYMDIVPGITSATPVCWSGSTPAGNYRISYVAGALHYANDFVDWNVNNILSTGYYIKYNGGAAEDYFSELTTAAFASQALAEAANAGKTHDIVHTGGTICMYLKDTPYTDNHPGSPNPTFKLTALP